MGVDRDRDDAVVPIRFCVSGKSWAAAEERGAGGPPMGVVMRWTEEAARRQGIARPVFRRLLSTYATNGALRTVRVLAEVVDECAAGRPALSLAECTPVPPSERSWYVRPRRNFMLNTR